MRKRFEQWYAGDSPRGLERNADGEYKYMPANVAWRTWQAATAVEREACAEGAESAASDANKYDIANAIRDRSNVQ